MNRKAIVLSAAAIALVYAHTILQADSWVLKPEVKDTEYKFGDTRIVLHYDSTKDRSFPRYDLKIYAKDKLLTEHENVGFEELFSDSQKNYFLGVSNRGLINQAYVIFDRQGRIIKMQKHDPAKVRYAQMSVTLIRKWYDAKNPQPEFVVQDGKLLNVRIRALGGEAVSLIEAETKAPQH